MTDDQRSAILFGVGIGIVLGLIFAPDIPRLAIPVLVILFLLLLIVVAR